jgi:hypothetical protein
MSARHKSFTLSRDGLKPEHYVPLRLRVVDTLYIASGVPMVIAIVGLVMVSFRWADQLGLGMIWRNQTAFYAYVIGVFVIASWVVCWAAVGALRFVFLLTGMMTKEEARSFPLRAGKKCVDPWPESWQRPCTHSSENDADGT